MDLLGMAGRRPCLPMVVCCSTRDELDAVCFAVSNLSHISMDSLVLIYFSLKISFLHESTKYFFLVGVFFLGND